MSHLKPGTPTPNGKQVAEQICDLCSNVKSDGFYDYKGKTLCEVCYGGKITYEAIEK